MPVFVLTQTITLAPAVLRYLTNLICETRLVKFERLQYLPLGFFQQVKH